jgi:hypothetical protein
MKSLVFCTGYFPTAAAWQIRYDRWLNYYTKLNLQSSALLIIDDASPYTPPHTQVKIVHENQAVSASSALPQIFRFNQHLGRQAVDQMPGWWRSFLHAVVIAKDMGVQKIIHIESDAYVLSQRLLEHLTHTTSGWSVLWANRYSMPETAIQIICEDQFEHIENMRQRDLNTFNGLMAEKILPFTHIKRDFLGDRYSETRAHRGIFNSSRFNGLPIFKHPFFWQKIPSNADFVAQTIPQQVLKTPLCQPTWQPPDPMPARNLQLRRKKLKT